MTPEGKFKRDFKDKLRTRFPKTIILDLDPTYNRSIPDTVILGKNTWAVLEFKKNFGADERPNQGYYVGIMNKMSFARFVQPENAGEVMDELERLFIFEG